jgi:uncharacterized hydrophobic protein (TIGR00271 family)
MRQIFIKVPHGLGDDVLRRIRAIETRNAVRLSGSDLHDDWDLILVHVPNDRLDDIVDELEAVRDLHLTVTTAGVMVLEPGPDHPPIPAFDITPRSPLEVFINRTQGGGSTGSFLGYSVVAGIVAWIGLYEEVIYLLTASMLVAPFAGPALNSAVATAAGDLMLLRHSAVRYAWSIGVAIVTAAMLSLVVGQQLPTPLMSDIIAMSSLALLLPLGAGLAGGLFVVHSEDTNIVSGAAVGILVAAALAPPAGILGMSLVMLRWDLVLAAFWLLSAQLIGINLVAALVFRWYRLSPDRPKPTIGRGGVFPVSVGISATLFVGLAAIQFVSGPSLQRVSVVQNATQDVRTVLDEMGLVEMIDAEIGYSPFRTGPDGLVAKLDVIPLDPADVEDEEALVSDVRSSVEEVLAHWDGDAERVVDVRIHAPAR